MTMAYKLIVFLFINVTQYLNYTLNRTILWYSCRK